MVTLIWSPMGSVFYLFSYSPLYLHIFDGLLGVYNGLEHLQKAITYWGTDLWPESPACYWNVICVCVCVCVCVCAQLCPTLHDPMDSLPGSPVHRIFQARILERVAISSFRGFSQPRDWTCISCIGQQILYHLSPLSGSRIHLPMQETQESQVRSLGWENSVEEAMATHSRQYFRQVFLGWKIPWSEEPGGL